MNKILGILGWCTFTAASLQAEEPVRLPPQGLWTIDVRSATPEKPPVKTTIAQAPGTLCTIRVSTDGNLRQDIISWSNGKTYELWRIGREWVGHMPPHGGVVMVKIFTESSPFEPWMPLEEKDLLSYTDGVNPVEANFGGAQVLLYRSKRQRPPTLEPKQAPGVYIAELWVDPKTRLPLALKNDDCHYLFTFSDQPPPALKAPEEFMKEMERFERQSRVPKPQAWRAW